MILPAELVRLRSMDNLASHYSYDFCKTVAEQSKVKCPSENKMKTGDQRREWLQSEEKRIVVYFTPFHGSWLNMVEIWFGILGAKCLKESYSSPDNIRTAIDAFAQKWNLYFSHPFKWTYTGEGLHEKAVNRFIKFLDYSTEQLNIKFLTKQLLLMSNLIENYKDKIQIQKWVDLRNLLFTKKQALQHCIDQTDSEKRKLNANQALENLFTSLKTIIQMEQSRSGTF